MDPLSPLMANVFVGFFDQQLFDKVQKSYCYFRYVDDIFAYFSSHNETLNFHLSLTFTMEEENNNMLTFSRRVGREGPFFLYY